MNTAQLHAIAPALFTSEAYSTCSEKYRHVNTALLVDKMRDKGFNPTFASQSRTRQPDKTPYAQHLIRFRHHEAKPIIEGLYPEVVLINSHDGGGAFRLLSGLFRFICQNGLVVGSNFQALTVPHTKNAASRVIEGSYEVIQGSQRAAITAEKMTRVILSPEKQLELARAAHKVRFTEPTLAALIRPESLLSTHRPQDMGNDLFTIFNRVQENAIKGGINGRARRTARGERRTITRTIHGISQSTALNRSLWDLAEAMV